MAGLRPLNRQRAQVLMEREELDALVLIQPESIVHGQHSGRVHGGRTDFGFPHRVCTTGVRARSLRAACGERPDHNPDATGRGRPAQRGDVIRLDLKCSVDGYTSDCARTAVLGRPSADQQAIYDALHSAFDAGLELLRPGGALREVHAAAIKAMRACGFDMYCRGHFGHGVGASLFVEEWPFIAADEMTAVEPQMVLAYETPWYIRGLGAFTLEDQFIVGQRSVDVCWTLPRELAICD